MVPEGRDYTGFVKLDTTDQVCAGSWDVKDISKEDDRCVVVVLSSELYSALSDRSC